MRLIDKLRIRRMLDGMRGQAPADVAALARALSSFSVMAAALSDLLSEVDVNPITVHASGCVAVDALVVVGSGTDSSDSGEPDV